MQSWAPFLVVFRETYAELGIEPETPRHVPALALLPMTPKLYQEHEQ